MSSTNGEIGKPAKITFESLLPNLGGFGKYQKLIYLLLGLPAISCAMHALAWVFLGAKVNHRCLLPNESSNAVYGTLPDGWAFNETYPLDPSTGEPSQCSRYDFTSEDTDFNETESMFKTVSCGGEYVFDTTKYQSSARIDFGLICDHRYLYTIAETVFKCGILIGAILFGDLSDRLGRRPIFFFALVLQVTCGIIAGLANNYWTFVIARMILGASNSGIFLGAFVIALELVGPDKRVIAGIGMQYFFTVGYVVVGVLAYFIRDWHMLQLALSLPGLLFLSYYWIMPESILWLLAKGNKVEAVKILKKVCKMNGTKIPEETYVTLCAEKKPETSALGIFQIVHYPRVALRSLNIFFCWFVNSGVYYGLALNSGNLGGNDYVNFALSGAVEIPAYTFLLLSLNRFGRKCVLCGCLLAGGIFLVTCAFIPEDFHWLLITLNMLGKMCNAASYAAIYLFSAELFPTVIRHGGMGVSSVCARLGGISSDYVILLGEFWKPLPHFIFGGVSLAAGLMSLLLPETYGKRLPETMIDGETFGTLAYQNDTKENGGHLPTKNGRAATSNTTV